MGDSIVKAAANQIGSLLTQEAQYIYAVKDKVEHLQRELNMMHAFLLDVDAKSYKDHSEVIRTAIHQIRNLAYEAEDIVEKYLCNITHRREDGIENAVKWSFGLFWRPCDIVLHHEVRSEIDALTEKLSNLTSQLQRYRIEGSGGSSSSSSTRIGQEKRKIFLHMLEDDPVGLDQVAEMLVNKLLDTNTKTIGISGMGGLGKSTLAKKVYKDSRVRQQFDDVVWVSVSQQFHQIDVLKKIYVLLDPSKSWEEVNKLHEDLLPEILNQVFQEKKILLVLDDLWTAADWTRLQPAFWSIQTSSSKILITSRSRELLQNVDAANGFLYELQFLDDKQSWELFQNRIGTTLVDKMNQEHEMERMGKIMVRKCKGLPLAIVALSGILGRKSTTQEWTEVSKILDTHLNFKSSQQYVEWTVSRVLELSYDDLPYYLRPCFLYLASFPEDFEICVDQLWHLWEAEGYLMQEPRLHDNTSRDVAMSYLNELAERYLILSGERKRTRKWKTCRMHDTVRDMCARKAREENFLHVAEVRSGHEGSNVFLYDCSVNNEGFHRVTIHGAFWETTKFAPCITPENMVHLRSLMIFTSGGDESLHMSTMLKTVPKSSLLRVLNVDGFDLRERVPQKIGDLMYLRYLSFRGTSIRFIPSSINKLRFLVTLDLRTYNNTTVWPRKMWKRKMESLRHLYLPKAYHRDECGHGLLRLSGLINLEILININPVTCKIKDLYKMTKLRKLSFTFRFADVEKVGIIRKILACPTISSCAATKPLILEIDAEEITKKEPNILQQLGYDFSNYQLVFGRIPKLVNLESLLPSSSLRYLLLSFYGSMERDPMPILGNLPQLKCLYLSHSKGVEMACSKFGFPLLTTLVLYKLYCVEDWKVEEGAMPNLIQLCVTDCPQLVEKAKVIGRKLSITVTNNIFQYMKSPLESGFRRWVTK